MNEHAHDQDDNPLQGYFDWQVNTLMLARDLVDPLARGDGEAHRRRREQVEQEVRRFSLAVIPRRYIEDPDADWPPEVMMTLTRATFDRVQAVLAQLSA